MRPFVAILLAGAVAGAALAPRVLAVDCPDGQCPIVSGAPGELPVDARPIARIENTVGGGRSYGSGTLVAVDGERGAIVTCAHLFREGTGAIVARFPDGTAYAAALIKIDRGADLAALAIQPPNCTPVEVSETCPRPGDPVVSCGYGGDGRLWCNRGRALGYVTTCGSHGRETLELSGTARRGDSGGPVLDASGRLVAVVFGTDGRVVDGTFCGRVRKFLDELLPSRSQRQAPSQSGGPLVPVPPRNQTPEVSPQPHAPRVELSPQADPLAGAAEGIESVARPWLSAKLAALLISLGIPGGVAGVAGGAAVWLLMRRGKRRLQSQLDRLKVRVGESVSEPALATGDDAPRKAAVARHHTRYVPYEVTELDRAWSAAHARVGEKYPGAVPYLKIVEGVKDQLLSGNEEPTLT